jgi:peptide/nickel transport system substrate-binding protein
MELGNLGKVGVLATVVGLALAACGGQRAADDSRTLTLAVVADVTSWDPAQAHVGHQLQPYQPVYDTLIQREPDGTLSPMLATGWAYNDDRTELTLDLRTDVTFSDGTTFDAAATKVNLEHFKAANGRQAAQLAYFESAEIVDADTLKINLTAPDPAFEYYMSQAAGLMGSPAAIAAGTIATTPVGTGPYVYDPAQSLPGSQLAFTARQGYWNPSLQKFDKIVLRPMAETTARLNAVVGDLADATLVDARTVAHAERAGLTVLKDYQVDWQGLLLFDRGGTLIPALGDVRVRQAINYAIDRTTLLDQLQLGYGTPTAQVFGPSSGAYVEELDDRYPYDPAKARQLLAEAGYADGFEMRVPASPAFDTAIAAVAQQLGEVGIRVQAETAPQTTYVADLGAGKYPTTYFNLFQGEPWVAINQLVSTRALYNPFDSTTPELQSMIDAVQNGGERSDELAKDVNRYVTENAWFVPLFRIDQLYVMNGSVTAAPQIQQAVPSIYNYAPANDASSPRR